MYVAWNRIKSIIIWKCKIHATSIPRLAMKCTRQLLWWSSTNRWSQFNLQPLTFWQSYVEREQGKVVVYTTSMGVVRETFQRCLQVQRILGTLLVAYEERDVAMNRQVQVRSFPHHFHLLHSYDINISDVDSNIWASLCCSYLTIIYFARPSIALLILLLKFVSLYA